MYKNKYLQNLDKKIFINVPIIIIKERNQELKKVLGF